MCGSPKIWVKISDHFGSEGQIYLKMTKRIEKCFFSTKVTKHAKIGLETIFEKNIFGSFWSFWGKVDLQNRKFSWIYVQMVWSFASYPNFVWGIRKKCIVSQSHDFYFSQKKRIQVINLTSIKKNEVKLLTWLWLYDFRNRSLSTIT